MDTDKLNRQKQYTLMARTGTLNGTFISANLPSSRWHVVYRSDGSVKLIFNDGTLIKLH